MSFNTVLSIVVFSTVIWVAVLLGVEVYQLYHKGVLITDVLRKTIKKLPWPFILLALTSGFMMGHCFGN